MANLRIIINHLVCIVLILYFITKKVRKIIFNFVSPSKLYSYIMFLLNVITNEYQLFWMGKNLSFPLLFFLSLCERHSANGALIWCCFWSSSASHCFRCRVFPNSLGFDSTSVQFKVSRCLLERGLNSREIVVMFLLGCVMWSLLEVRVAFECWNLHGCIAVRRVLIIKMSFCHFPCGLE